MNDAQTEGVRGAVVAALSTLTPEQIRELTMQPYMELRDQLHAVAAA